MYEPIPVCGTENVSSDMSSRTGNVAYGIRPRDALEDWRYLIVRAVTLVATRNWGMMTDQDATVF
jgi:hypothetical protein